MARFPLSRKLADSAVTQLVCCGTTRAFDSARALFRAGFCVPANFCLLRFGLSRVS